MSGEDTRGSVAHNARTELADPIRARRLDISPGTSRGSSPLPVGGDVTPAQWKEAVHWRCVVEDPWEPCILALDGGGIRGYSSALILKELMHRILEEERRLEEEEPTGEELPASPDDLLPCHYFDFMYGTSTGGLIAVMLARLRMSIGECLQQYREVGDRLFGRRRTIIPFMTKYRSGPLVQAVKDLVEQKELGTLHPWDFHVVPDNKGNDVADDTGKNVPNDSRGGLRSDMPGEDGEDVPNYSRGSLRGDVAGNGGKDVAHDSRGALRGDMPPNNGEDVPSHSRGGLHGDVPEYEVGNLPRNKADQEHGNTQKKASTHIREQNGTASSPLYADGFTSEPSPANSTGSWKRNDSILAAGLGQSLEELPIWDPDAPRVCQSCCLTAIHDGNIQKAHLLRSYPHVYHASRMRNWMTPYNSGADPFEIWQVTRATSAAPLYFDMLEVEVDGQLRGHKDGGIRENNPAGAAWTEFSSLYYPKQKPALLLSIGTGRTNTPADGFMSALPWPWGHFRLFRKVAENISVIPNLLVKYTESEGQHQTMLAYGEGESTWYKRLNVSSGLDNMPLDSWVKGEYHGEVVPGGSSLKRMEDATNEYLAREVDRRFETFAAPKVMIKHAAEKLVRIRRARKKMGGPRWNYYIGEGLRERMAAANMATPTGGAQ
ncbi:hypothetical protein ANO11243_033290 [Dothideomycetidae sp. 11243]|nr:hypothetical protein ANO11243_033290 [fungal sp. No.11243]